MMRKQISLGLAITAALVMCAVVWMMGDVDWLSWEHLEATREHCARLYLKHPVEFTAMLFTLYVFVNMFSIPIATLLALMGGAIYGKLWGTLLLSTASAVGGCGTFFIARFGCRQKFEKLLAARVQLLQKSWGENGIWLLLSLRLQPVFPYVLVNILFGLSRMPLSTFAFWSWLALIPNTFIVVYAGRQLSTIHCPQDIYRLETVVSLLLLALVPWMIKIMMASREKNNTTG
jgi:uncharacterized membrane protein YdjX (TVP38/TMEM64 family)